MIVVIAVNRGRGVTVLTWGSLLTERGGNSVNRVSAKHGRETEKNGRRLPPWYKVVPGRTAGAQFVQISLFHLFKSVSTKPRG